VPDGPVDEVLDFSGSGHFGALFLEVGGVELGLVGNEPQIELDSRVFKLVAVALPVNLVCSVLRVALDDCVEVL
jgi:hypothetical protein